MGVLGKDGYYSASLPLKPSQRAARSCYQTLMSKCDVNVDAGVRATHAYIPAQTLKKVGYVQMAGLRAHTDK